MDLEFRDRFVEQWRRHFDGAALPFVLFYTDDEAYGAAARIPEGRRRCVVAELNRARKGETVVVDEQSVGCPGGRRYLGFTRELAPNFDYFLSCGIPGEMEGERYKKTPEMVREIVEKWPEFDAPGRYAVFKRWDKLEAEDEPAVVIFYAIPSVLSGLFTLANFDETDPRAVVAPFAAGCATICQYPLLEGRKDNPRAVLGMFDVSARPWVPGRTLSFSVPIEKFRRMVGNIDESFLITDEWKAVHRRIAQQCADDA